MKKKILVVDDNAGNRLLLQYSLSDYFEVDFATGGLSALEKFNRQRYDAILMDVQMPDMDGIETTLKIRQMEADSSLERTPVLAVTSIVFREQKEVCLESGMDDFIVKPIHAKALVDRINSFLKES